MSSTAHLLQQQQIRMIGAHDRQESPIVPGHPIDIIGHDAEMGLCSSPLVRSDNDEQQTQDEAKHQSSRPVGLAGLTMIPGAQQRHYTLSHALRKYMARINVEDSEGSTDRVLPPWKHCLALPMLGSFSPERVYRVAIYHAHCISRERFRKLDPLGSFVACDATADIVTHLGCRQSV